MWERLHRRLPANVSSFGLWITLTALAAVAAFYAIGFTQAAAAHDVFHDLRHALGMPCH
ncbi:MAG: CbtB domain-containing protein [Thermoplasmata archaeon]